MVTNNYLKYNILDFFGAKPWTLVAHSYYAEPWKLFSYDRLFRLKRTNDGHQAHGVWSSGLGVNTNLSSNEFGHCRIIW